MTNVRATPKLITRNFAAMKRAAATSCAGRPRICSGVRATAPSSRRCSRDRPLRSRGGGVHRHRPEGDVHLRGQREGGPPHAASRGHRRGLPRLRGTRHAQAAPAGEAAASRPLLPPRGSAGRPLPPVRPDRRRGPGVRRLLPGRELILLLDSLLDQAGVRRRLRLSSLGNADTRAAYGEELRAHLRAREAELSEEVRGRIEANPLRAFDSDHPGTRAVMADAPLLTDRLDAEDAEHFADVRGLLDDAGVAYDLDPTLVRGLDYYTRTVFEFDSPALGAQSGVGGGGRYDGLVEQLGGPATPGVGWAAGVERIPLAGSGEPPRDAPVFVAISGAEHRRAAFALARDLRSAGVAAEVEQAGRSIKGQMKHAGRLEASAVVIVADRIQVKDMGSGKQVSVADAREAIAVVAGGRCPGDRHLHQPLPQRVGRPRSGRARRRGMCAWPGGCKIVATTAAASSSTCATARAAAARVPPSSARRGTTRPPSGSARRMSISAAASSSRRGEGTVNPELPTGEVELEVASFDLLADARTPPFQIDEDESRSRARKLRLRVPLPETRARPGMAEAHGPAPPGWYPTIRPPLRAGRAFSRSRRRCSPGSTPEGAKGLPGAQPPPARHVVRAAAVAAVVQAAVDDGRPRALLPDRPLLSRRGLPRRPPAGVHPARRGAVLRRQEEERDGRWCDSMVAEVLALAGIELDGPIERVPYDEALLRYGTDRPDRRIDIEIADLGEVFAASEFKVFAGALAGAGWCGA